MSAMKKQLKEHISKKHASMAINSDLMVEILSRVPAKSVERFHCVSKSWDSLLSSSYFTNMFLKRSSDRLRLLFSFHAEGKLSFFSTPQNLISDHNSNLVVIDNHVDVPKENPCRVCDPVCGLLCTKDEWLMGRNTDATKRDAMICNPSIGQFQSLPKVKSRRVQVITYMGYDPIDKQYKVLCMTITGRPFLNKAEEYQVLTLGTGKLRWRMIECGVGHYPFPSSICINGVLYYLAWDIQSSNNMVVCFDVKHEKFSSIVSKVPIYSFSQSVLINYKGKLGGICQTSDGHMDGRDESVEVWVLDTKEEQWSKFIHMLPPLWKELVADTRVYIVGMIGTSEIVFSPLFLTNPFYIYHLDMETNSIRRVEVQGIRPLYGHTIFTFINHVENLKPIM